MLSQGATSGLAAAASPPREVSARATFSALLLLREPARGDKMAAGRAAREAAARAAVAAAASRAAFGALGALPGAAGARAPGVAGAGAPGADAAPPRVAVE
jgi:hypothetical protein